MCKEPHFNKPVGWIKESKEELYWSEPEKLISVFDSFPERVPTFDAVNIVFIRWPTNLSLHH